MLYTIETSKLLNANTKLQLKKLNNSYPAYCPKYFTCFIGICSYCTDIGCKLSFKAVNICSDNYTNFISTLFSIPTFVIKIISKVKGSELRFIVTKKGAVNLML